MKITNYIRIESTNWKIPTIKLEGKVILPGEDPDTYYKLVCEKFRTTKTYKGMERELKSFINHNCIKFFIKSEGLIQLTKDEIDQLKAGDRFIIENYNLNAGEVTSFTETKIGNKKIKFRYLRTRRNGNYVINNSIKSDGIKIVNSGSLSGHVIKLYKYDPAISTN